MSKTEIIEQQQRLLAEHRRTLARLLGEAAKFGAGFLPAHVANGIAPRNRLEPQICLGRRGCNDVS